MSALKGGWILRNARDKQTGSESRGPTWAWAGSQISTTDCHPNNSTEMTLPVLFIYSLFFNLLKFFKID